MELGASAFRIYIVSKNTFLEAIRSKILHVVILFGVILVALASLFGSVSIGDLDKVIKSFGYTIISLSGAFCVIIAGVTLFHKEIAQKTIYNMLSKPLTRSQFVVGKFLGLWATGIVLCALMMCLLLSYLYFVEQSFDLYGFEALFFMILEIGILSAVTILYSSVSVTPVLPGLCTLATYIAGKSIYYLKYYSSTQGEHGQVVLTFASNPTIKRFIDFLYQVLPDLHLLTPYDSLVYGQSVIQTLGMYAAVYALLYMLMLLIVSMLFFERRDF